MAALWTSIRMKARAYSYYFEIESQYLLEINFMPDIVKFEFAIIVLLNF